MRENEVKAKLLRGETAIGTMLFELFVPGILRLMATTGAELAIYDMEHTGMSFETLRMLVAGSRGPSPAPMARIPAAGNVAMAEDWISKGYRAIAFGADHRLFAESLKSGIEKVRTFVKQ